jgi:hypothetical protein
MFLRFERQDRRLYVALVINGRVNGKTRQTRLGYLGSVLAGEPFSVTERMKFWAGVGDRYRALAAKHPGIVLLVDEERIRDALARRIPRPSGAAELRLLMLATVQRDLAAIDNLDGAEDVFAEVAQRLQALAREARPKAEAERLK